MAADEKYVFSGKILEKNKQGDKQGIAFMGFEKEEVRNLLEEAEIEADILPFGGKMFVIVLRPGIKEKLEASLGQKINEWLFPFVHSSEIK